MNHEKSWESGSPHFRLWHFSSDLARCPCRVRNAHAKRTLVSRSDHAAAARSSLSVPRATILRASSGNGRCNALASSHGARIHTSYSAGVVKITGMAFAWIGYGVSRSYLQA